MQIGTTSCNLQAARAVGGSAEVQDGGLPRVAGDDDIGSATAVLAANSGIPEVVLPA